MSISALSRKAILPVLFLGLAAMLIGFFSYRLTNPTLIKQVEIRAPQMPEAAALPDSGMSGGMASMGSIMNHPELLPRISELMLKLSEDPDNFDTRMELAEVFMQARDPAAAAQHLQRAVELQPENYIAHYYLGIMFYALQRYEEAVQSFEQALTLEEDPYVMFNLALLYLQYTDREAEALALLERTAAYDEDPELQESSRRILKDRGKP
jgi:tetratricopeptide (TPR) repeat protein